MSGKASLIVDELEQHQAKALIVDSGNIFFPRSAAAPVSDELKLAGKTIAQAYAKMGYEAVGLHPRDLLGGYDFLQQVKETGLPVVSANLLDRDKQRIFPSFMIKVFGDQRIAIIGVTGQLDTDGGSAIEGIIVADWKTALEQVFSEIAGQSAFVILLSSLTGDENKQITSLFPQIKVIFTADPMQGSQQPTLFGDCLLTQIASRGKYLGRLDISYSPQGNWSTPPGKEMRATHLQNRINAAKEQLQRLQAKETTNPDTFTAADKKKLTRLSAYNKQLENELASIMEAVTAAAQNPSPSNTYRTKFLPVYPVRTGTTVDTIMESFRDRKHQLQRQERADVSQKKEDIDRLLLHQFIAGTEKCATCHEVQTSFWQTTGHSRAYFNLQKNGNHQDISCLPCHVNGGSVTIASPAEERRLLLALSPGRRDVGCEICHGPGRDHASAPTEKKVLMPKPPEALCTVCHTKDKDPDFNYSAKSAMIRCPAND